MSSTPPILVVGGGLAGMAAALSLANAGQKVTLIERKRNLGGRASSFLDSESHQAIDYCQHVSLGCCTNLTDFCEQLGIADQFERIRTLHFIGPGNERCKLAGSKWLPAPLHLLPVLWGLKYLSVGERYAIARSLRKLSRHSEYDPQLDRTSMQSWLETEHQSGNAITGFWKVILISALSEDLENISVAAARKVFVDGFMSAPEAYEMLVPKIPLGELYGEPLREKFTAKGISLLTGCALREIQGADGEVSGVQLADGTELPVRAVVLAVPWRAAVTYLESSLQPLVPELSAASNFASAPITGVHLWFDRPITELPHAVLVNRLCQWLFKPRFSTESSDAWHYYQVVISASHELASLSRDEVISRVLGELKEIFPAAGEAHLKKALVVTERNAVFSPKPGIMADRPSQRTAITNLFLAGDWTATDWPATMEGAVRSGYLAAEKVCEWLGQPQKFIVRDLQRAFLARMLIRE